MQITIEIDDPARIIALERKVADFNAFNNATLSIDQYVENMVEKDLAAYVAANLTPIISVLDFLQRLTADERIQIRAAAQGSPEIADYLGMLEVAQYVDLTDPRTIAGVNTLESAGLIGAGRAAEILSL